MRSRDDPRQPARFTPAHRLFRRGRGPGAVPGRRGRRRRRRAARVQVRRRSGPARGD